MAPEQQRQLRKWLREGAAVLFRQHLLDLAAAELAQGANLSQADNVADVEESKEFMVRYALHNAMAIELEACSAEAYSFQTHELKPRTATVTENYATPDRHHSLSFPGSGQTPDPRALE
jgi:hypothetical protein